MPFQENNITHFPIIFGRNLLAELDGFVLAQLGYKNELLAMEQTRQGSWNRQFVAYNLQ